MQPAIDTKIVNVTSNAVQAIQDLMNEKNLVGYAFRLFISGRTCSGFQYGMSLDDSISDTDSSVEVSGIKVVIDNNSLEFIKGSNLDFIDDLNIWKLASERNNGLLAMLDHIKAQAKGMRKDKQTESFGSEA